MRLQSRRHWALVDWLELSGVLLGETLANVSLNRLADRFSTSLHIDSRDER